MRFSGDFEPGTQQNIKSIGRWWSEIKHLDRIWWMVENGNPGNSAFPPSVGIHHIHHVALFDVKPGLGILARNRPSKPLTMENLTNQCEKIVVESRPVHEEMGPDLFLARKTLTKLLVTHRAPLLIDLIENSERSINGCLQRKY